MEGSHITWTDHTWNPWWGCQHVSPGCAHCYAEALSHRYGRATWGPGQARRLAGAATLREPHKWAARARRRGVRERVFCPSMGDWADPAVLDHWRAILWETVRQTCDALQWLLLSKRPQHWPAALPEDWGDGWPGVALGVSIEDQAHADERVPLLMATPARHRFLSIEPLLGPIDLSRPLWLDWSDVCEAWAPSPLLTARVLDGGTPPILPDWIIVGGESGPRARRLDFNWIRTLRDQAAIAAVPFFFKQWGGPRPDREAPVLDGQIHQDQPAWSPISTTTPSSESHP